MRAKHMQDSRPLIFLAVLMAHAVIVLWLIRSARQAISPPAKTGEPLVLMLLHELTEAKDGAARRPMPAGIAHSPQRNPKPDHAAEPDAAASVAPDTVSPPPIDWQHEAEAAAQARVAAGERERGYRNLSGLSAAQLDWIKENRMVPAPAGIHWKHPRVEFIDHGLPIPVIWVNDHCVLIAVLFFCRIGHIEPNGDLFKHLRDPHDPHDP